MVKCSATIRKRMENQKCLFRNRVKSRIGLVSILNAAPVGVKYLTLAKSRSKRATGRCRRPRNRGELGNESVVVALEAVLASTRWPRQNTPLRYAELRRIARAEQPPGRRVAVADDAVVRVPGGFGLMAPRDGAAEHGAQCGMTAVRAARLAPSEEGEGGSERLDGLHRTRLA